MKNKSNVETLSRGNNYKPDTTAFSLYQNKAGITLVALVITIIVLLILAGITINLTVGQRGILNRAKEAGKNYVNAAEYEDKQLAELTNRTDQIINGMENEKEEKYTTIEGVPVPKGFEHVEGTTKENGFVIKDISVDENGNPSATNGNEFVWVPCTEDGKDGSIKYDRYAFTRNDWGFAQIKNETTEEITRQDLIAYVYTETMPIIQETKTELDSIKQYGGFYIGRYKVGVVDYDTNVITSNTNHETEWTGYSNARAVVQENKQVWNYITRDMAKKVSKEIYTNNESVTSKLCSNYAWDTTLKFIEMRNIGYATNSEEENYSGGLKHTGIESIAKNNIYDMGGNVREWTTGNYSYEVSPCTIRGGDYNGSASTYPAGHRDYLTEMDAGINVGFRITLYIQ